MNIQKVVAHIKGNREYPMLHGTVMFKRISKGVLVTAKIYGLPDNNEYNTGVFAFHIHNGMSCTGTRDDPFADAGTHYNPKNAPHPYHAGDLPPLFSNNGYAYMSVLTNRFNLREIIGRVVIIHRNIDDFSTQPAGNAGAKIGCGKIIAM
ncbi:MAG: superoxide dismutase family protein [Clostridiales bacterium]|nr:superoxide dismutase family protein [Clostridiales bacterium]